MHTSAVTTSFSITLLNLSALDELVPQLQFADLADMEAVGPFVYVLVEPSGGIVYVGKSDAADAATGRRAMAYARWNSQYLAAVADSGRPDPMYDPDTGTLDIVSWSPIVRFASRYSLTIKVASITDDQTGTVWEARLKALLGTLTGLESVVGASGWEFKPGSHREAGYEWAQQQIAAWRRTRNAA